MSNESPDNQIVRLYTAVVNERHPGAIHSWPIVTGYNVMLGGLLGWLVVALRHTANRGFKTSSGLGELPGAIAGVTSIDPSNKAAVRRRLEKHLGLQAADGVVLVDPSGRLAPDELDDLLRKHERVMGLSPMKIFLSHKGADKAMVRRFASVLVELGFDAWLDEDAMPAGVELERGILKGFHDSCAAIFFVTPNFVDEKYLGSEVNYAIAERREKGDKFAIVTLVLEQDGKVGTVPDLLRPYVWKTPKGELDALREVLRALPIQVGDLRWRM